VWGKIKRKEKIVRNEIIDITVTEEMESG
jgi:hypothetical protein